VTVAHTFLAPGAVGPFSGVAWPVPASGSPGAWVEAEGPLVPCTGGVHAYRPEALPFWLDEELWAVELDDAEAAEDDGLVVSRRGRLLRRVEAWDAEAAGAFALACAERAEAAAGGEAAGVYAADAVSHAARARSARGAAVTAYIAARAAEEARPGGGAAERALQARWLVERLGLAT
jgi:hypothetical protein